MPEGSIYGKEGRLAGPTDGLERRRDALGDRVKICTVVDSLFTIAFSPYKMPFCEPYANLSR